MTGTDLYKPSDDAIIAAMVDAGLPDTIDPENLPDTETLKAMRGVLNKTIKGWADFVDGLSLTDLGRDTLNVKVSRKGRLIEWRENEEGTIKVRLGSRHVTRQWAVKRVRQNLPFMQLVNEGGVARLRVRANVGTIRERAVKEFTTEQRPNRDIIGWNETARLTEVVTKLLAYNPIASRAGLLKYARLAFKRYVEVEEAIIKKDTGPQFVAFMRDKRDSLRKVKSKSIELLPVYDFDKTVPTSRTWGIEIESGGARGIKAPVGWDRKYDGSLHSAYGGGGGSHYVDPDDCEEYNHREFIEDENGNEIANPDYDNDAEYCDYCGTVENEYYDDYDDDDCAEFVSPILSEFHERGMKRLLDELDAEPQNDSAGVHVHVGAGDLTPKNIGALTYAYQIIEPLIEDAYQREIRNYCRVRPQDDVLKVIRSSKVATTTKDDYSNRSAGKSLYHGDRYHSVNLQSLNSHGTIEFRAMGPVYSYDHLIRWALFCREMVNISKKNLPAKIWNGVKTWNDVTRILAKYGEEVPAMEIAKMEEAVKSEELVTA